MATLVPQYRLLFLHHRRTGSTSIHEFLCQSLGGHNIPEDQSVCNEELRYKHTDIYALEKYRILSRSDIDSLLKFSTIRNPWDSLASAYQKIYNKWHTYDLRSPTLDPAIIEYAKKPYDFIYFLESGLAQMKNTFWAKQSDKIIRFENLNNDLYTLLTTVGYDGPVNIPHLNKTDSKNNYRQYYSDYTRDLVYNLFTDEIDQFGYEF